SPSAVTYTTASGGTNLPMSNAGAAAAAGPRRANASKTSVMIRRIDLPAPAGAIDVPPQTRDVNELARAARLESQRLCRRLGPRTHDGRAERTPCPAVDPHAVSGSSLP